MSALNSQVSEVHSIMRKNIQDVLARGAHLDRACASWRARIVLRDQPRCARLPYRHVHGQPRFARQVEAVFMGCKAPKRVGVAQEVSAVHFACVCRDSCFLLAVFAVGTF